MKKVTALFFDNLQRSSHRPGLDDMSAPGRLERQTMQSWRLPPVGNAAMLMTVLGDVEPVCHPASMRVRSRKELLLPIAGAVSSLSSYQCGVGRNCADSVDAGHGDLFSVRPLDMSDDTRQLFRQSVDLESNELPDGYVVYDRERDKVHFLNITAAILFELCDGRNTVAAMAEFLQKHFELPYVPTAEVEGCLADLQAQRLIEHAQAEAV
ncbi:PqqD family protein [Labrys neptuniae]